MSQGIKETSNKLNYELDWNFIEEMAKRMSKNKDKYPPYNWKLKMDIESLKQALLRHTLEVMKGNFEDNNEPFGHLAAIALNAHFLFYQLNNIEKIEYDNLMSQDWFQDLLKSEQEKNPKVGLHVLNFPSNTDITSEYPEFVSSHNL